jgi:predicted ABC-type sugar transport system permease subunit
MKLEGEKMIGYLFTILVTALSLLVVDIVLPGVDIQSFPAALVAGVAIGLVNAFVKPILSLLTLPVNFLTLAVHADCERNLLLAGGCDHPWIWRSRHPSIHPGTRNSVVCQHVSQ